MATKTRSRRVPASRRRQPARLGGAYRAPQRRKAPTRKPPRAPLAFVGPTLRWVGVQLRDAPAEAWGLAVVATGIVAGFGVYRDGAGPLGRGFRFLSSLAIGSVGILVPILLVAAGLLIVVPRLRHHVARLAVGAAICTIAVAGLVHLLGNDKRVSAPIEKLQRIGGIIGALVARPLSDLIGVWFTALVLCLLAGVGVMILARIPVRQLWGWCTTGFLAGTAFLKGLAAHVDLEEAARDDEDDDEDPYESAPAEPIAAVREPDDVDAPMAEAAAPAQQLVMPVGNAKSYKLPPIELLTSGGDRQVSARSVEETTRSLEETLQEFKVDARVTGYSAGPTVTRFEIELGSGVKVNRVLSLSNEIKYSLASGELRFLAPIPGRSAIGIEVPNRTRQLVTVGDVLRSKSALADKHPLAVALGKDVSGEAVLANLTEMPHLLIAGATNSGKSSCLNSMLTSILMRARPDQVRLILIDPKRVELSHFAGVPHLITPVVSIPKKAASALQWVVREMEARYETLAHSGMRNLEFYNEAAARGAVVKRSDEDDDPRPLPYILVVVDELSDLMMVAPRDVENAICRIAQMARAVGIHLVVATQRPSVDVVTGVIKANIPSRFAFSVASQADSRVILDQGGAENLIGHGDMLFLHANSAKPVRIQGSWVNEKEMAAVVGHCRRQGDPDYIEGVTVEEATSSADAMGGSGDDELLQEALELVVRSQLGSTSMLQRKLQVGFARAGRIMDLLEQRGVVGPSHGSKPRDVLMTVEELEARLEAPQPAS
ncbi:MAG: segregation ATPase FtsK/SpoIIIE, family [Actinomycetota bacterium]|nr:segregation ATPase FtsK/SpoIIIE, family [Actinomycetota bacterium]